MQYASKVNLTHPLLSPPYFVSNTTATHGTSSSHGYGLRLRYWLQLPMELRLRMVMDFASAVVGCIGNNVQERLKRDYRLHEQPSVEEEPSAILTKRTKLDEKFNATKSSSELLPSTNVQYTSTIPNSNDVKTKELEADEEIKFDIMNVSMELNREPTVKSVVINYGALLVMSVPHLVNNWLAEIMDYGNAGLNRMIALMFNDLYYNIPEVAPSKLSEEEHCDMFIYPLTRLFRGSEKEYELRLNRANAGSKTRPDLSCIVNDVLILNSEFKPQYDGLYRSWPFLTTKLVIDKATIPLAEFAISHFVALEERVEKIAKDFKYRSSQFTPPAQMSFVRKLPDSPQVKMLLQ
ncbi:14871_t:CDS:2 [Acaulospora colombiana]|uniref:14871_t:CDS:1 n=1 Tax=Acaulospora colombiana TaxID=27376 RepID=A0ACA9LCH4_9GLOM|nr:14871_t:CDS:2 [Acaulospora colombiana]